MVARTVSTVFPVSEFAIMGCPPHRCRAEIWSSSQVMCSQVSKGGKMQANSSNATQDVQISLQGLRALLIVLFLVLTGVINGNAEDKAVSNKQPLSFGKDQTIIDLNKVVWEPLTGEGIPPGPEPQSYQRRTHCLD
jgi:hypothetical protein